jgi:hypothetical protein
MLRLLPFGPCWIAFSLLFDGQLLWRRVFAQYQKQRRNISKVALAVSMLAAICTPLLAQGVGRPQDGFYSGQSNGQYSGQYYGQGNSRVDGRGSHNQGFPPSAADRGNRFYDNPIQKSDCSEVDAFASDARPGWQARVRLACQ